MSGQTRMRTYGPDKVQTHGHTLHYLCTRALGLPLSCSYLTSRLSCYRVRYTIYYFPVHVMNNLHYVFLSLVPSEWAPWGQWSGCSASCGNGTKTRLRSCLSGNPGDGNCLPASANQEQMGCNLAPCLKRKFYFVKR